MRHEQHFTAALAALRAADTHLKAFTCVRSDASAVQLAASLSGPLEGQLVGIKDIFDTADMPTAYGSPIYAGYQPSTEAAMVAIIRNAGGLVAGKTVTTEFAFLQPAATLNPAAPGCTPGGSSAGSAAAVAAGLVPLAVGSQTGGSTVRPASYCGIAGFKPGFGLLPTAGMKCFSWSLDTVGLFATSVKEVGAFAQAASGGRIAVPAPRDAGQWRVGIPASYPWGDLGESADLAMNQGIDALRAAGVQIVDCAMPRWVGQAFIAHDAVQGWEAVRALSKEMDARPAQLSPLLRDYLLASRAITDAQYAAAQALARAARQACSDWLDGVDVLMTPSAPGEAPEGYGSTGASTFNRAFTLLGTPALSVPGAVGVHGRPMGLQLVAPQGGDGECLAAGLLLERLLLRR